MIKPETITLTKIELESQSMKDSPSPFRKIVGAFSVNAEARKVMDGMSSG